MREKWREREERRIKREGKKLSFRRRSGQLFFIPLVFTERKKKLTLSLSLRLSFFFFKLSPLSGMQAADARSECTVIAARMQTGPCAKLQDATMVS